MRKAAKLLKLIRKPRYLRGLRRGSAAAIEHDSFLQTEPYATLIDAGANKGQFALAALEHQPAARIIAFEPLPGPAATFEAVFSGEKRVTLHRLALGSADATVDIHVSKRADSSSLLKIGRLQSEVFPGTEEIGTQRVTVATLDKVLEGETLTHPVLLKIDVQGFELELLKGAERSLAQIDSIYVELSFISLYDTQPMAHMVIDWLKARGFVLAGVYHISNDSKGRSVQADMHFKRMAS